MAFDGIAFTITCQWKMQFLTELKSEDQKAAFNLLLFQNLRKYCIYGLTTYHESLINAIMEKRHEKTVW